MEMEPLEPEIVLPRQLITEIVKDAKKNNRLREDNSLYRTISIKPQMSKTGEKRGKADNMVARRVSKIAIAFFIFATLLVGAYLVYFILNHQLAEDGSQNVKESQRRISKSEKFIGASVIPKTDEVRDRVAEATSPLPPLQKNYMKLVGDGNRCVYFKGGEPIRHWKPAAKSGNALVFRTSHILINETGDYQVDAKLLFSGNSNRNGPLDFRIMRNRELIEETMLRKCLKRCKRSISKRLELNQGDHVSIQSKSGASFLMREDLAMFSCTKK